MGTIETHIYPERDLTVHSIRGKIGSNDVIAAMDESTLNPTLYVIWDFRYGDATGLDTLVFDGISRSLEAYGARRGDGRTAFVFTRDVDFGIGRMIERHLEFEGFPVEVMCFRSLGDAYSWLGSGTRDKRLPDLARPGVHDDKNR